jgi:membrane-bound metal-dependent hydrolase YbcI (DUF457 family)
VFIEHIIYSAALAIIIGMIYSHFTGRDPSLIIIVVAFVPDIDLTLQTLHELIQRTFPFTIHHGDFHNILFLIVFSLILAAVLCQFGVRFIDGFICSSIGIAAHFLEDALVFKPAYAFLWPFTSHIFGIGIMTETPDFFGIANSIVMLIGIILLTVAVLVRTHVEGRKWLGNYFSG